MHNNITSARLSPAPSTLCTPSLPASVASSVKTTGGRRGCYAAPSAPLSASAARRLGCLISEERSEAASVALTRSKAWSTCGPLFTLVKWTTVMFSLSSTMRERRKDGSAPHTQGGGHAQPAPRERQGRVREERVQQARLLRHEPRRKSAVLQHPQGARNDRHPAPAVHPRYEGCVTRPNFNYPGQKKPLFCMAHKLRRRARPTSPRTAARSAQAWCPPPGCTSYRLDECCLLLAACLLLLPAACLLLLSAACAT